MAAPAIRPVAQRPAGACSGQRFEAVVLHCAAPPDRVGDARRLRELVEAGCALGLHLALVSRSPAADVDRWLGARPRGPGTLHLVNARRAEAHRVGRRGPRLTERLGTGGDGAARRWIIGRFWRLGVAPSLVVVAPNDAAAIVSLLEEQIEHRRRGELPRVPEDRGWCVVVDGATPEQERAIESRLTIADGCIGTRGSVVTPVPGADPAVFVAGVYHGLGAASELLRAPLWNRLASLSADARVRRVLDLRTGLLHQEIGDGERLEAMLLSSAARPGTAVLRAAASLGAAVEWGPPLLGPEVTITADGAATEARAWLRGDPGGLAVAASQREACGESARRVDRIAVFRSNPRRRPSSATAARALRDAEVAGFEQLLNEHRATMAERWETAGVAIAGDPELERAARFCLFHLLGFAADRGEAAVGARGLTGAGYRGHVFWHADVFVLPFLAATHPHAARAMLEYRIRRLPAALAAAESEGTAGAHLPWESAATGEEVTPRRGRDRRGRFMSIRTGDLEEHIVADVAWAASCYAAWSGDAAFLAGAGRELVLGTARWWAARAELDAGGRAHIRGVCGPDEYHFPVDDNAFTNVMARWNLRQAAALAGSVGTTGVAPAERTRWRALADALVDGYDAATGVYEQFAGFHALEPFVIGGVAPRRPVSASALLGSERVAKAQIVKQADVLMLHHLVPDEVAAGSLVPNLAHYEPRTAHASSLSPGVHASLLARAGRVDDARDLLALTASIDLDDITGNTAGGLHLAAMGSVWQALAWGFAGLRPEGEVLRVAPRLPDRWEALELRLRFRGAPVRLLLRHDAAEIDAARSLQVRVEPGAPRALAAGRHRIALTADSH